MVLGCVIDGVRADGSLYITWIRTFGDIRKALVGKKKDLKITMKKD